MLRLSVLVPSAFALSVLILSSLILSACAHTSRRPAAAQKTFAERCEKSIQVFLSKVQLDGGDSRQTALLNASLQLAEFDLPNRTRKVLATKNPSCSLVAELADINTELVTKNDEIAAQHSSLESYYESTLALNSGSALQDPLFARRASCVALCQGDEAQCAKQCGASESFIEDMT